MAKEITETTGGHASPFERIKRTSDAGIEFWSSRDFSDVLGNREYQNEPIDTAIFQNQGVMGLYGGLRLEDIHRRKGLKKSQKILVHMGSTELAANLFRATQAEEKLRRDKVKGKDAANRTHREVGAKVRQTINELGGTMPEELPVVESIKKIASKQRKSLGKTATSPKKKRV
jgi:hypothetical protein